MKRFWDTASVEPIEDGYRILLDDRLLRLPGGAALGLPNAALAAAIAAEWQLAGSTKGGTMDWDAVPLTRLAGTAQERIAPNPAPVLDALAGYAESDLLCYRADWPPALAERERVAWQPWLDWAAAHYGARLEVTRGIVHRAQDKAALAALRQGLDAIDALGLAALGVAVPLLGSLVLGLAMATGALDAAAAHGLAGLDEIYQAEQWGEDPEAVSRRARIGQDLAVAGRLLRLARP